MGKQSKILNFNISLLIVEPSKSHAESFVTRIQDYIPILNFDYCSDISQALAEHINKPYDLCLISQVYPDKEVSIFLKDIQKLYLQKRQRFCSFVQFRPEILAGFEPQYVIDLGFSCAISEKLEESDIENLKSATEDVAFVNKLNEHMSDIDWTMKMILKEVDRVSRERKRGREAKFNKIALVFAAELVEFDPRVLSKYFETLGEQTEKSTASGPTKVKIPTSVLKRSLPKLLEEGYTGASSRVWNKLLKKYGSAE